jgi:general secretion pathway protein L
MPTLIVALPMPDETGDELRFLVQGGALAGPAGERAPQLGRASADRLPAGDQVVAVVPARMLSWHKVSLPKIKRSRWRQALDGLLEERLLDDAAQLHFALEPGAAGGQPVWVAVCSKPWLSAELDRLQQAGRPADRIVPELQPPDPGAPAVLAAMGQPERAWLASMNNEGVQILPLGAAALALSSPDASDLPPEAVTEPAVAAMAEQLLGRPASLRTAAQTLALAEQSRWDLAQFDLAGTGRFRWLQQFGQWAAQAFTAPAWRPARWGLIGLLLTQLIGLNVWALRERALLQDKQADINSLLTRTFPKVQLVVDAPLQMEREAAAVSRASGNTSPADLEAMLTALAQAGATPAPSSLSFAPNQLTLAGFELPAADSQKIVAQLGLLGYRSQIEGNRWVIRHGTSQSGGQP